MIAKGKAIAHGGNAIGYALKEHKRGDFFTSNLVEGTDAESILKEFEMVQQYNSRCKNKFLRFEIGIAPEDERKLSKRDLGSICRRFSKRMGLSDTQWIACTHKDTDNLHIHLIANRMDINGNVYNTDFISNKASKVAEAIAREMGLVIANDVFKQRLLREKEQKDGEFKKVEKCGEGYRKQYEKPYTDFERKSVKVRLQDIAYGELRKGHRNINSLYVALIKQGITPEFAKNKQGKVYGLRFYFDGYVFKASEVGKEFGLRSLYNHFGLRLQGQSALPAHLLIGSEIDKQNTASNTQQSQQKIASNSHQKDIIESMLDSAQGVTSNRHSDDYEETAFKERMEFEERKRQSKGKRKRRGRGL